MRRPSDSTDSSTYWDDASEYESRAASGRSTGAATAALDVMDRFEAFVAGSHELEMTLKKQKERTRAVEAELMQSRQKIQQAALREDQLLKEHAVEKDAWASQFQAYEEKIRKLTEYATAAQRQCGFLQSTLGRYQKAWNQLEQRENQTKEILAEKKALAQRLEDANARLSEATRQNEALERACAEERKRNQELVEGIAVKLENLDGAMTVMARNNEFLARNSNAFSARADLRFKRLEQAATAIWSKVQAAPPAPKRLSPTPPPFRKK